MFRISLLVVLLHLTDRPPGGRGLSALSSWTVRPCLADRPPLPRGPSARAFAGQLSPLLLELCFCFGII
jgi:hypothetical protein